MNYWDNVKTLSPADVDTVTHIKNNLFTLPCDSYYYKFKYQSEPRQEFSADKLVYVS